MLTIMTNRPTLGSRSIICLAVLLQVACREASTPKGEARDAVAPSGKQREETPASAGTDTSAKTAASETGDPKLETLIADLSAKWDRVASAKADITMTAEDKGSGQNLTYGGYGQFACKKIDGRLFIRRDMVNGMVPRPGQTLMERNSTIITGPEFSYFFGEEGGKPFAQKRRTDLNEIVRLGGRTLFHQLKRLYTLTPMPDAEIEGRAVRVISGTPPGGKGRVTFSFSSDSGAMVQMKMETDTGESSRTVSFSNIELNPELDDGFFEFKPPPGVDVLDFTKKKGSK